MRKNALLLAMLLVFSIVLVGCQLDGKPIDTNTITPVGTPADTQESLTPTLEATPSPQPTLEPSQTPVETATATQTGMVSAEVQRDIEAMMPIMDSIMRSMGVESESAYAPRDEEFFWTVLYLTAVNWGNENIQIETDWTYAIARRQLMQEYASAAFLDYDDLLPIPDSMAQSVEYDEGLDAYRLMLSDVGDSETRLISVEVGQNGSYLALVGMYDGSGELYATMVFTLVPNPYASGISDPTFLYTVSDVSISVG